jgi:hypothetical protein
LRCRGQHVCSSVIDIANVVVKATLWGKREQSGLDELLDAPVVTGNRMVGVPGM